MNGVPGLFERWADPGLGPEVRASSLSGAIALGEFASLSVWNFGVREWGGKPGICSPCFTQQRCLGPTRWVSSGTRQCDKACTMSRTLECECSWGECSAEECAASTRQQLVPSMSPPAISVYEIKTNQIAARFITFIILLTEPERSRKNLSSSVNNE
jgi:hypothetical protein